MSKKGKNVMNEPDAGDKITALASLDEARLSWFHIKAILISGCGFFTDAYDIFIINLVMPMIGYVYYADGEHKNHIPNLTDGLTKGAASWGTLVGQLLFGVLGDKMGRKKNYAIVMVILIVSTIGCALAGPSKVGWGICTMIAIWRFFLGVGIGGDYPMSAVITSEFATVNRRGFMIASVFAMQGVGILLASVLTVVLLLIFKGHIEENVDHLDTVWRICIAMGAVPSIFTLYYRVTFPETPRYAMDVKGDIDAGIKSAKAAMGSSKKTPEETAEIEEAIAVRAVEKPAAAGQVAGSTWKGFKAHFGQWRYGKVLLGCALSWFLLDLAFYGLNLNQSIVLEAIGFGDKEDQTAYDSIWNKALGNLIIAAIGTVPGYWVSVFLIEKIGRKPIQLTGFAVIAICLAVIAIWFHKIVDYSKTLFFIIYIICQFFFNFGPNMTTFVIPSEVFPTRFRTTAHGLSAASGKLGAIIAAHSFSAIKDIGGPAGSNNFIQGLFGILSFMMVLGFIVSTFLPETKGKTLEELAGEEVIENAPSMEQLKPLNEGNEGIDEQDIYEITIKN
ncbi:MFS general substrate transporter [Neocallimastix lanati (nom. inval.)]|jgi:PHS family inorganic phosphate transporter-like MFS transporter|uniref:Phosphate:H+ symporter n=1 Tax=Neocallimastix californiae TaxID=1754190 RepID=A0A1Y2C8P8_9FUNG|nr:MFS general substrate transporter [Neocallimastix sp. JGI-2020a]ORY43244.1 phosphate:H+ symporter [Neocallimastix californiae]|eukprot:ORY43244.1 phosphate:H+ symporter [Neocallimastix californiae]